MKFCRHQNIICKTASFPPHIIYVFTSCHKLICNRVEIIKSLFCGQPSPYLSNIGFLSLKYVILTTVHCGCFGICNISVVLENRESSLNFLKTYAKDRQTWSSEELLLAFVFWKHDSRWKDHRKIIFSADDTRQSSPSDLLICCAFWSTALGCYCVLMEYFSNLCLFPLTSGWLHVEIWFQILWHKNKMLSN